LITSQAAEFWAQEDVKERIKEHKVPGVTHPTAFAAGWHGPMGRGASALRGRGIAVAVLARRRQARAGRHRPARACGLRRSAVLLAHWGLHSAGDVVEPNALQVISVKQDTLDIVLRVTLRSGDWPLPR
jgi:hypothetical protein